MLFSVDGYINDGQKDAHSEVAHSNRLPVVLVAGAVAKWVRVRTRLLGLVEGKESNAQFWAMAAGHNINIGTQKDSPPPPPPPPETGTCFKLELIYKPISWYTEHCMPNRNVDTVDVATDIKEVEE